MGNEMEDLNPLPDSASIGSVGSRHNRDIINTYIVGKPRFQDFLDSELDRLEGR